MATIAVVYVATASLIASGRVIVEDESPWLHLTSVLGIAGAALIRYATPKPGGRAPGDGAER